MVKSINVNVSKRYTNMKYEIRSNYHNTDMITSIRSEFCNTENVLTALDYELYNHGELYQYAKKKLKEIKKTLCGSNDCKCSFEATLY